MNTYNHISRGGQARFEGAIETVTTCQAGDVIGLALSADGSGYLRDNEYLIATRIA